MRWAGVPILGLRAGATAMGGHFGTASRSQSQWSKTPPFVVVVAIGFRTNTTTTTNSVFDHFDGFWLCRSILVRKSPQSSRAVHAFRGLESPLPRFLRVIRRM